MLPFDGHIGKLLILAAIVFLLIKLYRVGFFRWLIGRQANTEAATGVVEKEVHETEREGEENVSLFRKRPQVVTAFQLAENQEISVRSEDGEVEVAKAGDWLVRDQRTGQIVVVTEKVFSMLYESVGDGSGFEELEEAFRG